MLHFIGFFKKSLVEFNLKKAYQGLKTQMCVSSPRAQTMFRCLGPFIYAVGPLVVENGWCL